ncbi:MAG: alanine--tRNA ligase [Gammaproteobacteria bacterium]|nr:alanine--tRNA ligase [Gammaproteobacteria bacterium]
MASSNELRLQFLNYFKDQGHEIVASSPLVPGNDPTLLFTNAGMVQFKDVFLGTDKRPYSRATTSQRCVRAGGKHNDLENVGYTARHHTFFEMLGNFSFGDYFKRDAIRFAWRLLTDQLGMPPEKLWVTVYEQDDEAEDLWFNDIGIDRARFSRCGAKDNFWSMGDTGPCGPCSEIFYDHGPSIWGGPPGSPQEDGDRYIEIWNLVFMQFNRDEHGAMTPLPKPSVDTGMGLERLAAVIQDVHSNYEIDLFVNLIAAAAKVTGAGNLDDKSLRVIADHIRSVAFLVVDGVMPSPAGRGYVLRRIARRAIRHGHKLGMREPFFYRLVGALEEEMGAAYPELAARRHVVEKVLRQEEERFAYTLDKGMRILEQAIGSMSGSVIDGGTAFTLYETYGFPVDLTADIARERELGVDMVGFDAAMAEHRQRGRASSNFAAHTSQQLTTALQSEFVGYDHEQVTAQVLALFKGAELVDVLQAGDEGAVLLDATPFYAESGGQVGDQGQLTSAAAQFTVSDTKRNGEANTHYGKVLTGELRVGEAVSACIDEQARRATMRNHSGTHLLHAALRNVLGEHVMQKGSLVEPGRLRFDFSHFEPTSPQELSAIERQINDWILANDEVITRIMPIDEAMNSGALALFGEKYEERVRVLSIGNASIELCGGTHVARAGDIGLFKVLSETGVAGGIRRIEAVTGEAALDWLYGREALLARVSGALRTAPDALESRVHTLAARIRELEKDLQRTRDQLASSRGRDLLEAVIEVSGIKVLAVRLDGVDAKGLPNSLDQLKERLGSGVVVIGTAQGEKVSLVAGVTRDLTGRVQAGPLVNYVAGQVGGKGGGREDMARAGGKDPAALDGALASVPDWIAGQLVS